MGGTNEQQLIDYSSFKIKLKEVRFDEVPVDSHEDDDFALKTKDDYDVVRITDDKVELEFRREKYFEPEGFFKIKLVFGVFYRLHSSEKVGEEREKIIKEELDKEYRSLLAPVAAMASLIVSALTSVDWKVPFIDPPLPIIKKKNE
ncbi:MAG TPA: hypothetical protein GX735_08515 [Firmicutes bacterium]|jgi:hypothetical protein|nr:hypothetical protein [Bacillota bacterium]